MDVKELARQAFRDQQSQDNEGGVPCSASFVYGFVEGYQKKDKTGSLISEELKNKINNNIRLNNDLKNKIEHENHIAILSDDQDWVIDYVVELKNKEIEELKSKVEDLEAANHILKQALKNQKINLN